MAEIRCRAQVSADCHQLRHIDERAIYESGTQAEDGTYRPNSRTVVCTPCYMRLGMPPNQYLERAVRHAREALGMEPV